MSKKIKPKSLRPKTREDLMVIRPRLLAMYVRFVLTGRYIEPVVFTKDSYYTNQGITIIKGRM